MAKKKLNTVSVDSEAEYELFEGLRGSYIQITITGTMPSNKDKVTVFNLDKEALTLLLKQLEKN